MKRADAVSLKETLHQVLIWADARGAGPLNALLVPSAEESGLILRLIFPSLHFTNEESEFFGRENRIYSMNGSTPRSFLELERMQNSLRQMGGRVVVSKAGAEGLALMLMIPADPEDPADATSKIRMIERELKGKPN